MGESRPVPVAPSNAEAMRAWDGAEGAYWADNDDLFDLVTSRYDGAFLRACAISPGDRVLDVGCGNGHTTREAARRAPCGYAVGVDLSSAMVERARRRAAERGVANARFEQGDAQVHPFGPEAFDLAISRTGAMFFGDPVAAFRNIAGALRPGGRITLLTWQAAGENEWVTRFARALTGQTPPTPPPGAPGPFSLADPGRVRSVLEEAGFTSVRLDGVREPACFGPDTDTAYRFVAGLGLAEHLLSRLDGDDARSRARARLRADLDSHTTAEGVLYASAAWIVTAHR